MTRLPAAAAVLATIAALGCGNEDAVPATPPAASQGPAPGLTSRAPVAFEEACEQVGSTSGTAVYCPTLVPSGRLKVEVAGPVDEAEPVQDAYVIDMLSPALERLRGRRLDANGGHWTVAGGTPEALHPLLRPANARPRRVERLKLDDVRVTLYRLPPAGGRYGGHVVAAWRRGGLAYHVSVHGYANRERLLGIARSMVHEQSACRPLAGDDPLCRRGG